MQRESWRDGGISIRVRDSIIKPNFNNLVSSSQTGHFMTTDDIATFQKVSTENKNTSVALHFQAQQYFAVPHFVKGNSKK